MKVRSGSGNLYGLSAVDWGYLLIGVVSLARPASACSASAAAPFVRTRTPRYGLVPGGASV
jgi:hypothetical protein